MARHYTGDSRWKFLEYDAFTQQTKWYQTEGEPPHQLLHIRVTQPDALTYAMLEGNKREANDWQSNGGWGAAKLGAVVAKVPTIIDTELKKKAGYNPLVSGWYDQNKYNSFLDDIDYQHLRTGGGRIGRRKKSLPSLGPTLKAALLGAASPLVAK